MADFNLNNFLSPILDQLYNPGAFSDKITEDQYIAPYTAAFDAYVPYIRKSFEQNKLNPFNQDAQNQVYGFQTDNSSTGNWRTGSYGRNLGQLNDNVNLGRSQLEEGYNNDVADARNQVTQNAKDIYASERQNYYLSPTFLTKGANV